MVVKHSKIMHSLQIHFGGYDMEDYEIKVDGHEHSFEGGAIRYEKDKGRFDLIPTDVEHRLLEKLRTIVNENIEFPFGYYEILNYLTKVNDKDNEDRFIDIIIALTFDKYLSAGGIYDRYNAMLRDLAIHFQKGAKKYGERNCEKGIELWSFIDSGTRHTLQFLSGETDEPHYISAIWNFWMADWTIHKKED